jgi:3,4-dihydroxy-9,10-secoandrosta-1,3,5(10)-triene-9,17-dione 4,5-dioxygenase
MTMSSWRTRGLGYLGINSADVDGWRRLAVEVLGLQEADSSSDDRLLLKMDDQRARIFVHRSTEEGLAFLGWELGDLIELEEAVADLEGAGVAVKVDDEDVCTDREVAAVASFVDPEGNNLDLYVGARHENVKGFRSPTGARFVAGDSGLGHVVLWCANFDETLDFYTKRLGLGVTDLIVGGFRAAFLGNTRRHHSVALFGSFDGRAWVDHLMIEVDSITAVGQAHDRCLRGAARMTHTLGQHWNDGATSFYVETPSGFDIEYGTGGLEVDRATWTPNVGDGEISYWGHHGTTPDFARKLRQDHYLALSLEPFD